MPPQCATIHTHVVCAESEWIKVDILETTQKIIARASSRVFVGLPACAYTSDVISSCMNIKTIAEAWHAGRNQAYLDLAIKFAMDVMKDMFLLACALPVIRP